MTKPYLLIGGLVILLASSSVATEPVVPISKETARTAITLFRQNPLSPRGRAAGEAVRMFAEKDESVIIQVTAKVVPFLSNVKIPHEDRALLLDAFVVGNIDSQFLRNEKKDDPYSGVVEMIAVYRQMQKEIPGMGLAEMENLIELEKRGELKQYVASP